jgi:hypothetical protein
MIIFPIVARPLARCRFWYSDIATHLSQGLTLADAPKDFGRDVGGVSISSSQVFFHPVLIRP